MAIMVSCSRADDEPASDDSQDGEAVFTFTVTTTRADATTTGDGYEVGTANENNIDIDRNDYRVLLFDSNNKFLTRCYGVFTKTNDVYTFVGTTPKTAKSLKVVVLANWGWYEDSQLVAGKTTISDLCSASWAQYSYDGNTTQEILDGTRSIPMFGVRSFSVSSFTKGKTIDLTSSPITLLRAMAKVELSIENFDSYKSYSFSSVAIQNYNTQGYCAPNVTDRDQYDHDQTWSDDYAEALNLVSGKETTDAISFVEDKANNKWIIYLPEYQNLTDDGTALRTDDKASKITTTITMTNNDGTETKSFDFYFAEYYENNNLVEKYVNVERNNIYRYKVRISNSTFVVDTGDWNGAFDNTVDFK